MATSAVIFRCCRKPDWSKSPRVTRATGLTPVVALRKSAAAAFSTIWPCLSGWSATPPRPQARKGFLQASSASFPPVPRPFLETKLCDAKEAAGQTPRRHHHGWQWTMGDATAALAPARARSRRRSDPARRRSGAKAGGGNAHALRLLKRQLAATED